MGRSTVHGEPAGMRRAPTAVRAARIAWGATLLAVPSRVLDVTDGRDRRRGAAPPAVLRVLGARHLLQAALEPAGRRPGLRVLGAIVDGLHALSGLGLAAFDPRWRRAALADAAIATAFSAASALTSR